MEYGFMRTVKSVANTNHCSIPADRTIEDALRLMMSADTGVVVFIEDKKPVGVLTERDIVAFLHAGISMSIPLYKLKRPPITVGEDKTLLFGINMLIDNNIRRIVVVDRNGDFLGVVTQDDLIQRFEGGLYEQGARIMDIISQRQPLRTVSTGESLSEAARLMTELKVGSVLVTEKDTVVGIITERDMLRIAGGRTELSDKVETVMSRPVISASVDASVSEVLEIMKARKIRRILITYNDGAPFRVISNRDILKNIENSYLEFLNRKIRHAREVLDFLPEIIVDVIDISGEQIIQWCNRKTREEFGRDMANSPITALIPPETWAKVYPVIIREGRIEKAKIEIEDRSFEFSASYMKMQREGIIQAILMDITSGVTMSTRDFLTGVYNRRKFEEILNAEIERAKRYSRPLSFALLDIDHFKTVNDTEGHQAGDRVLQELTDVLAQYIRETDHLARYGGEEFMILAPDTDLDGMHRLAEKLRQLIHSHEFRGQGRITISVGVAQFAKDETAVAFFGRADAALYRAKAKGRNRVERSERGCLQT